MARWAERGTLERPCDADTGSRCPSFIMRRAGNHRTDKIGMFRKIVILYARPGLHDSHLEMLFVMVWGWIEEISDKGVLVLRVAKVLSRKMFRQGVVRCFFFLRNESIRGRVIGGIWHE